MQQSTGYFGAVQVNFACIRTTNHLLIALYISARGG